MPAWVAPAIGAGVSAVSALAAHLSKKSGKVKQSPMRSPDQLQHMQWSRNRGRQMIENPYEGFQGIADEANRNYYENVVPSLAERFNATGSNRQGSPSFLNYLKGQGDQQRESMAGLRAQYGQQQQQFGQNLMNSGLQSEFENNYYPSHDTFGSAVLGGISQGAGNFAMISGADAYDRYSQKKDAEELKKNNAESAKATESSLRSPSIGGNGTDALQNMGQLQGPQQNMGQRLPNADPNNIPWDVIPQNNRNNNNNQNMNQGMQSGMNFMQTPWNPNSSMSNYNQPWQMQRQQPTQQSNKWNPYGGPQSMAPFKGYRR